jgi:galactokinase
VSSVIAFAPGRVNLIGEHTDYNQGLALPFAIAQGVTVTAAPGRNGMIEAVASDLGERDSFSAGDPPPASDWRGLLRGLAAALPVTAARLTITGTVPPGAGLGSSAALEVALALALLGLGDQTPPDAIELARVCSRVENEWTGAHTGLLDQLASLLGQEGHALRIDFGSLEVTPIPLALGRWRLVTLDSGERHAHAASGYNQRRDECAQACRLLGLPSLREATLEAAERLPPPLDRRTRHVVGANARVEQAVQALTNNDLERLGALLDEGQASLRDLYEVSTPGVEATVARLRDAGAAGARLIGGGFGGQVLGLMPPGVSPPAGALEVRPGPGARVTPQ